MKTKIILAAALFFPTLHAMNNQKPFDPDDNAVSPQGSPASIITGFEIMDEKEICTLNRTIATLQQNVTALGNTTVSHNEQLLLCQQKINSHDIQLKELCGLTTLSKIVLDQSSQIQGLKDLLAQHSSALETFTKKGVSHDKQIQAGKKFLETQNEQHTARFEGLDKKIADLSGQMEKHTLLDVEKLDFIQELAVFRRQLSNLAANIENRLTSLEDQKDIFDKKICTQTSVITEILNKYRDSVPKKIDEKYENKFLTLSKELKSHGDNIEDLNKKITANSNEEIKTIHDKIDAVNKKIDTFIEQLSKSIL